MLGFMLSIVLSTCSKNLEYCLVEEDITARVLVRPVKVGGRNDVVLWTSVHINMIVDGKKRLNILCPDGNSMISSLKSTPERIRFVRILVCVRGNGVN